MVTQVTHVDEHNYHCTSHISWSAIIAGALVGVGLGFLLNLFGVAIGLSAFSMSDQGAATIAIGGLLGLIIATIIAMYFAGLTSGYLGRNHMPRCHMGLIYGFTTWSVAIILTAMLTAHLGSYIDTYTTTVTKNNVVVTQKAVSVKASTNQDKQTIVNVTPKEASGGMAVGAFIVFGMFFVGAFSSCLGAHHGMTCKKE